ncbi:hypothetical protein BGZ96_002639 [Linnemannia gamsii]|uniref:Uncharacterized protein n=1 Tax=Linnemannia gamsii TaxID=64522 RepID=A0ABQ7JKJ6_9FUNG|nr:hypothetical protein BGZ96_002639 [Linnemannia gamsii]
MLNSLVSLYIHFDASLYPLSLLWGISHLTNLIRLDFDVFYSDYYDSKHHPPELYMNILRCCLTLQIFIGHGCFLEQSKRSTIYNKDSKWVRLKRVITPPCPSVSPHTHLQCICLMGSISGISIYDPHQLMSQRSTGSLSNALYWKGCRSITATGVLSLRRGQSLLRTALSSVIFKFGTAT